jgi:hypothetical protein
MQSSARAFLSILVIARLFGCNENFATAISKCSGEVMAFSDQDDCRTPLRLERLWAHFEVDRTSDVSCEQQ